MTWSTPLTATASTVLTAAQWNASVRDNLLETAPAKATTAGGYFAASGANTIVQRTMSAAGVSTAETTTSTTVDDLATLGPEVTVTVSGGRALVGIHARMANNTVNAGCLMGFAISGATTQAVSTSESISHISSTANAFTQASAVSIPSLTGGSNTFTSKYLATAGTATFSWRRIWVMPF